VEIRCPEVVIFGKFINYKKEASYIYEFLDKIKDVRVFTGFWVLFS